MKKKWILHAGMLSVFLAASLFQSVTIADAPRHFTEAKKYAKQIFSDRQTTFYCGCHYDKHNKVNLQSCGYHIQKDKRRATRLEWEHIVPVSLWGKDLECWKKAVCCQEKKACYKGRACCRTKDSHFAAMEADLHNIVPEIGELNQYRSNYRFGMLPEIPLGRFGQCEIKIDSETRRVEPKDAVKGTVARAYLYMADQYAISLSSSQKKLYTSWNKLYPPEQWEIEWDKRVAHIQGNYNRFITQH
jgi:deoxyribonuclease-1